MKKLFPLLFGILISAGLNAQTASNGPLKDTKLSEELIAKLTSTPVANITMKDGEASYKLNKSKMSKTLPDGKAIVGAKIRKVTKGTEKGYFLAQRHEGGTIYLPLKVKGSKLYVDFTSGLEPWECLFMACESCYMDWYEHCNCNSTDGGDCTISDVSFPYSNSEILDNLFD